MLNFETDYAKWRESRLQNWPNYTTLSPIKLKNPLLPSQQELTILSGQCAVNNFALYSVDADHNNKECVRNLAPLFGLSSLDSHLCADNDSVSALKVMPLGRASGYIPYTNRPLNWHTDGYYNPLDQHIRSFILHCEQPAKQGGANMLLNHELVFIRLFDEDPALIEALMQPDALTIPANIENGVQLRASQSGPVFYLDPHTQHLQMRYTARSRSIEWKQDPLIEHALMRIEQLLRDDEAIHYTLKAGEGLICNNILHGRTAFTDGNIPDQQRVMYRVRSYDRAFNCTQA
jgi:hypothetical protein